MDRQPVEEDVGSDRSDAHESRAPVFRQLLQDRAVRTEHYLELITEYYERVTDTYRKGWGDSFHFACFSGNQSLQEALLATERRVIDQSGLRTGMRVLDIGCGVGGPALHIAERSGAHVTGLNIVENQLKIARESAAKRALSDRTEFVQWNAMRMPFHDKSFDVLYSFDAACYMPDKAAFLKECARVLRPGGVYIALDWLMKTGLSPAEEHKYIEPICRYHCIPDLISPDTVRLFLARAGLEVEELVDLSEQGEVLPNWRVLDNKILQGIRDFVPALMPATLRMLADGGYAILEGVKAGAFVLGWWRARKPLQAAA